MVRPTSNSCELPLAGIWISPHPSGVDGCGVSASRHSSLSHRPDSSIRRANQPVSEITFSEFAPRVRKSYSRIPKVVDIPNLLEIQRDSFDKFLQSDVEMEKRENVGLHSVFNSVFPIKDFNDTASLEFVGYALEQPKYDVQECLQRGMTYAAPFKVTIRLVAWDDSEWLAGDPRCQRAGGLLRRNSDHDRQRHLHHQRHRAGDRLAAAPLARDLLRHQHLGRR